MFERRCLRWLLTLAVAAVLAPGLAPAQPELTTTLAAEQAEYKAADALGVRFTLANPSSDTVYVSKWGTPLEGFLGDMFRVERDGEAVPYIGRVVKRGAPGPDDYVTLGPGESVSEVVDLAEAYGIYDMADYSVVYTARIYDVSSADPRAAADRLGFEPQAVPSNSVTLTVAEARERPPEPPPPPAFVPPPAAKEGDEPEAKVAPGFVSCSASRQTTLNQALDDALLIAFGGRLCLSAKVAERPNSVRYKTWFGTYDATRWGKVSGNFDKIYDALANKKMTFHCDCDESWYAYVYPNNPYHIWLCNAFWTAPPTGTDSRAGTLVHEVSHFWVVADTDDHVYGQTGSKNLANTDPAKAIENADSHEYFAENTPALACPLGLEHVALAVALVLAMVALDRVRRRRGTPPA